jgi:hypothetical protein
MHLAEDNDVVHTLAPDRPDQPFGKAMLPRRGGQTTLIIPSHDLVVVRLGHYRGESYACVYRKPYSS